MWQMCLFSKAQLCFHPNWIAAVWGSLAWQAPEEVGVVLLVVWGVMSWAGRADNQRITPRCSLSVAEQISRTILHSLAAPAPWHPSVRRAQPCSCRALSHPHPQQQEPVLLPPHPSALGDPARSSSGRPAERRSRCCCCSTQKEPCPKARRRARQQQGWGARSRVSFQPLWSREPRRGKGPAAPSVHGFGPTASTSEG